MWFDEKVIKLVDIWVAYLWGHFKDGGLQACEQVCWKKRGMRSKGDIWWWNDEVKMEIWKKKGAHKVMCLSSTE